MENLDIVVEYINTHKAKLIIAAIMISVVYAIVVPENKPIIINNLPPITPA